jgi:hypothetical protein
MSTSNNAKDPLSHVAPLENKSCRDLSESNRFRFIRYCTVIIMILFAFRFGKDVFYRWDEIQP